MEHARTCFQTSRDMPDWVSDDIRLYLDHVEGGQSIRALARQAGVHASTILRRVRKTESRRDDPLVDTVLVHLGGLVQEPNGQGGTAQETLPMTTNLPLDEKTLHRDASRVLRALMQPGAVLAVVPDVETAVVVVESDDGRPRQTATLSRRVAEAIALQGWIEKGGDGRVARYYISAAGRRKLRALLAEAESANAAAMGAEQALASASGAPKSADLYMIRTARQKRRPAGADSPLQVLARRRDKTGAAYLTLDLVRAGEQLRTDFELTQIGAPTGNSWAAIIGGRVDGDGQADDQGRRRMDATKRLRRALEFLGPELGEMALLTCCQQHGMEFAEKELHMPARAGKYVLRIALNMLVRHYRQTATADNDLIY